MFAWHIIIPSRSVIPNAVCSKYLNIWRVSVLIRNARSLIQSAGIYALRSVHRW